MEVSGLKTSRKLARSDITHTHNLFANLATIPDDDKRQSIMRLQGIQTNIKELDNKKIRGLCSADGNDKATIQREYDTCVEYEKKLLTSISMLQGSLVVPQLVPNPSVPVGGPLSN